MRFGGLLALNNVDLTLERGMILGLIGPNGAGKTTLVNGISGFQDLDSGRVMLNGQDITGMRAHRLPKLGLVRTFQSGHAFGRLTVLENVEAATVGTGLNRRRARTRARQILAGLELLPREHQPAMALPHGDERRLEIARALAARPRFLLADEPAAGLDKQESDGLVQYLQKTRTELGCGVLLIEHDMRVIMRACDVIQVLNYGETIAVGTPAEIRSDERVIEAYLGRSDGSSNARS